MRHPQQFANVSVTLSVSHAIASMHRTARSRLETMRDITRNWFRVATRLNWESPFEWCLEAPYFPRDGNEQN